MLYSTEGGGAGPTAESGRAAMRPESYGGRGPPLRDSGLRYLPHLGGSHEQETVIVGLLR
jgi:hypothetical protein